jgi:putative FmdB family regulatory protein
MPTYDYQCAACGHRFEHFQSMTSKVLRKCPSCGKSKLERLIGAGAGFLFKGSGFYITDYRSDSYQAAQKAEQGGTGVKDAAAPTPVADSGSASTPASAPSAPSSSSASTPAPASTTKSSAKSGKSGKPSS